MRILLVGLLLFSSSAQAAAPIPACTTLVNGASQEITVAGVCRKITNNTGRTICVPSANVTMWNSYIDKTVAGVTVEACS